MFSYVLLAAFVALGFWALDDFLLKRIITKLGVIRPAIMMIGFGVIPIIILTLAGSFAIPSLYVIILSIVAGIFFFLGYILDFKSLETEQVTNTIALGELQSAIIVLFGIFALAENASPIVILGIVIVFVGAVLVGIERRMRFNKKLLPAVFANVSWAIYWVILSFAILSYHSFVVPLLIARSAGFIGIAASVAIFGLSTKKGKKVSKAALGYSAIALMLMIGIFDSIGNLSFGYVALSNIIAIGASITALVPVIVGVLGKVFYKDKLTLIQLLGFTMCVIGAIVISLL